MAAFGSIWVILFLTQFCERIDAEDHMESFLVTMQETFSKEYIFRAKRDIFGEAMEAGVQGVETIGRGVIFQDSFKTGLGICFKYNIRKNFRSI